MKCHIMHYAEFYLDLHCLQKYAFTCFQNTKGYILICSLLIDSPVIQWFNKNGIIY